MFSFVNNQIPNASLVFKNFKMCLKNQTYLTTYLK